MKNALLVTIFAFSVQTFAQATIDQVQLRNGSGTAGNDIRLEVKTFEKDNKICFITYVKTYRVTNQIAGLEISDPSISCVTK